MEHLVHGSQTSASRAKQAGCFVKRAAGIESRFGWVEEIKNGAGQYPTGNKDEYYDALALCRSEARWDFFATCLNGFGSRIHTHESEGAGLNGRNLLLQAWT
jgi:hypothetical protein